MKRLIMISLALWLLSACGALNATSTPEATPLSTLEGPDFSINPIMSGATDVSGTGPKGVVIQIVDVTTMGSQLGTATIDQDGNFKTTLSEPAIDQHQIGIQPDTAAMENQAYLDLLAAKGGPNLRVYPNVGYVLDSTIVAP